MHFMKPSSRPVHGLLLAAGLACAPQPKDAPATMVVAGPRAEVRGVVRENVLSCESDGACYLVLRASDGVLHVIYSHGEAPRCENTAATRTGLTVHEGDLITATGAYRRSKGSHFVDVCCADCRLTVVPPQ